MRWTPIDDRMVGQLIQVIGDRTTRFAVVEDVGTEPDDEITVVLCATGAREWIPPEHIVPTGREAHPDDFTFAALAAIARRNQD